MAGSDNAAALGAASILETLRGYGSKSIEHADGMHTSVVIVALPEQMDTIRLVGDEEKHATLLFLGEMGTLPDNAKSELVNTLQMVSSMVEPFREGVREVARLGDEEPPALVSMLHGRHLSNIRDTLQVNPAVREFMGNASQFPSYTPHVTLGYPDYKGEAEIRKIAGRLGSIRFDRLALWWGDERLEFPLTYRRLEGEMADSNEAAWSADLFDNYLEHYGIKGMKWGVRRRRGSDGTVVVSDDAAKARAILSGNAKSASNADIQAALNRMKLEADFAKVQANLIPPSRGTRAANYVRGLLGDIGNEQVTRIAKGAASVAVEEALKAGGKAPKLDKEFAKLVGKRIVPKKK
jgi:2'-5' RNA ligase